MGSFRFSGFGSIADGNIEHYPEGNLDSYVFSIWKNMIEMIPRDT